MNGFQFRSKYRKMYFKMEQRLVSFLASVAVVQQTTLRRYLTWYIIRMSQTIYFLEDL